MVEVLSPAPHDVVLRLLLQVAFLLFAARALGELAMRLGQPSVVGEILAGIVVGPSLLGTLVPAAGEWLVPHTAQQLHLLEVFSLTGALFLLLVTGLETDLALIRRHARTALGVSAGGITVTLTSGFALGLLLPDDLLGPSATRLVFAMFVATAMSISAIPVIAKVLMDLGLMRRDIGQTIIASGMCDDTVGWILLSLVAGLAAGEAVSAVTVLATVGKVLAFLVFSFTAGRWLVKRALDTIQDEATSRDRLLTLVVTLMFAWAALTQALHLEAVLGAFVMGILFGQMPRLPEEVRHKLESLALGVFAPIFFAVAGLKVNLQSILEPRLFGLALAVIAVATLGKVVGTYAGARLVGRRDHWTALSFGASLNARGAMEIIIATIGLSLGILSRDMFSIVVLMAMATSIMAPPALRFVLRHVAPGEDELERLRREELAAGSLIARIHRVLVPVRFRSDGAPAMPRAAAEVLARMGARNPLSITLLTVVGPGRRADGTAFLDAVRRDFPGADVVTKAVESDDAAGVILAEAQKNYDLLLLGATERLTTSDTLFTSLVDLLVRSAPCTTLVVKAPVRRDGAQPFRSIVVPTNGKVEAKTAAELGFTLADAQTAVHILNVVREDRDATDASGRMVRQRWDDGRVFVDDLCALGSAFGARAKGDLRRGAEADAVILDFVHEQRADVLILGTAVHVGSARLFLGSRVERILNEAACTVIVVNTP